MIRQITVRNFKSLREVTVDLGPLTVLIGRSGSGKSNFVNAIRFLRDYIEHRQDGFVTKQSNKWRSLFCATAENDLLEFHVVLTIPGYNDDLYYNLSLKLRNDRNGSTLVDEQLFSQSKNIFHQRDGKWIGQPDVVGAPPPGSLMLGILYGIPEANLVHRALTAGIGCYDFPSDVLTVGNQNGQPSVGLEDKASNFLSAFRLIAADVSEAAGLQEIVAAMRSLNPSVTTVESEIAGAQRIIVGHRVADGRAIAFSLAEESEGFRRFLAHMLALHQIPAKQMLVFEESEKGIFPAALALLGEHFRACADRGRSQVILTTHSPQLLDSFTPEQIREVRMVGYETQIAPVPNEQLGAIRDHLMTTGELLTIDAAHLDPIVIAD